MAHVVLLTLVLLLVGGLILEGGGTNCTHMGSLLTYYINGVNGPCWPGFEPFDMYPEVTEDTLIGSEYTEERYYSGDEVATYIETAGTYLSEGPRVGRLGTEHLFLVETIHIDLTQKAANNPNYEVTVKDIDEWILAYGPIPPRAFVIFNTGWSFKRGNRYYGPPTEPGMAEPEDSTDVDTPQDPLLIPKVSEFTWPGISSKAAEYLLNKFFIIGIGIDTPSVDAGYTYSPVATEKQDPRAVRRFLTSYGMYLVHNLLLLDIDLPPRGIYATLGVFKIKRATRAPVNVYVEYCANPRPSLQCKAADYRNVIFGVFPHPNPNLRNQPRPVLVPRPRPQPRPQLRPQPRPQPRPYLRPRPRYLQRPRVPVRPIPRMRPVSRARRQIPPWMQMM